MRAANAFYAFKPVEGVSGGHMENQLSMANLKAKSLKVVLMTVPTSVISLKR
jgi:hypothetical protein